MTEKELKTFALLGVEEKLAFAKSVRSVVLKNIQGLFDAVIAAENRFEVQMGGDLCQAFEKFIEDQKNAVDDNINELEAKRAELRKELGLADDKVENSDPAEQVEVA